MHRRRATVNRGAVAASVAAAAAAPVAAAADAASVASAVARGAVVRRPAGSEVHESRGRVQQRSVMALAQGHAPSSRRRTRPRSTRRHLYLPAVAVVLQGFNLEAQEGALRPAPGTRAATRRCHGGNAPRLERHAHRRTSRRRTLQAAPDSRRPRGASQPARAANLTRVALTRRRRRGVRRACE